MNYTDIQIVLQEVPGEISICFTITGCPLHCKGCHSPHLWNEKNGILLTDKKFEEVLDKYKVFASCVLFMGGEWHHDELLQKLRRAKTKGYTTCLYTGLETVSKELFSQLTWLKTGDWREKLGGLDSEITNQKFVETKTNKVLNHLFIKK
jgi:anaerobic ribonucleoside-triphosphate reductase activating protein